MSRDMAGNVSPGTPVRILGRADRDAWRAAALDREIEAKELEADDPYELVGVRFPVDEGVDADREVGRCFVEDFALMGWPPERIRQLFEAPAYQGAFDIARRRGRAFVEELIGEVFGIRAAGGASGASSEGTQ